jgi:hypothetical protein
MQMSPQGQQMQGGQQTKRMQGMQMSPQGQQMQGGQQTKRMQGMQMSPQGQQMRGGRGIQGGKQNVGQEQGKGRD